MKLQTILLIAVKIFSLFNDTSLQRQSFKC